MSFKFQADMPQRVAFRVRIAEGNIFKLHIVFGVQTLFYRERYNEYMSIFSVVFQDFQLFSFTLGQNVAASEEYDEERVVQCLARAGLGERLKSLPDGTKTWLYKDYAEEGVEISGGEAQSPVRKQRFMGTLLHNVSSVKHKDTVAEPAGSKPVADVDCGFVPG